MPYYVIFQDENGKYGHDGPHTLPQQAQTWADDNVHSKFCEIIEARGRNWDQARNEVKHKLAELLHDANFGTKRIYDLELE